MNKLTKLVRSLAVAGTLVGVLAGPAQAAVAPGAGAYNGNACLNADRVAPGNGAEGCAWINTWRPYASFRTAVGAYDYARDGLSAETIMRVHQYVNGAWRQTNQIRTVASSGAFTSRVGNTVAIGRLAGASHVAIQLIVCRIDAPTGVRHGCDSKFVGTQSWAG